jgi:hypothetical protein
MYEFIVYLCLSYTSRSLQRRLFDYWEYSIDLSEASGKYVTTCFNGQQLLRFVFMCLTWSSQ